MMALSVPISPLRGATAATRRSWPLLAALGLFLLAGLATLDDYGSSGDERAHRFHASATIDYVLGNGEALVHLPDRVHGVAFVFPLGLIERALQTDEVRSLSLVRHLIIRLFFLAGGLFVYLITSKLFNNRMLALAATTLFLLHPRLYAHSFMNSKDISFLSMFVITLYLTHRAFRKDSLWAFALLGVGVGILINTRIMGMIFVPAVLAMRGFDLLEGSALARKRVLMSAWIFGLAAALGLYATWPYLWNDPISRFLESFGPAVNYSVGWSFLFQGRLVFVADVPPTYIPVWFSITTLPFVLLLGAVGIGATLLHWRARPFSGFQNTRLRFGLLLVGCFALPIAAVILLQSNLFGDWRHLYFLWAPFSLIGAFGLHWLSNALAWARLRAVVYGAAGVGAAAAALSMALIHPNQQVYFNFFEDRVTPDNLSERYVLDYWSLASLGLHNFILREETLPATIGFSGGARASLNMLPERDRRRISVVNPALAAFSVRMARPDPGEDAVYVEEVYENALVALVREEPGENPFPAVYEAVISEDPVVRSGFDLYLADGMLVYVKEPCSMADVDGAFSLQFYTENLDELPDAQRWVGYEETLFNFLHNGALFDGKCVGKFPLPNYPVLNVKAHQIYAWGNLLYWEALFPLDAAEHYAAYESAASRIPDVRAAFDLHLDEEARTLTYVKEPCALSDIERRFFAHIRPASVGDLPEDRRLLGFDNLDFIFLTRGVVFDGKCAAILPLPEYEIASVRTGQFVSGEGEVWEATVPFGD